MAKQRIAIKHKKENVQRYFIRSSGWDQLMRRANGSGSDYMEKVCVTNGDGWILRVMGVKNSGRANL